MATTEAQKKAQEKYNKNCISKSIRFTPDDMNKYKEMEDYLKRYNLTFSGLVKRLLDDYINRGTFTETIPEKFNSKGSYWICNYLYEDDLQMMIDAFGEDNTSQLLDDYADAISSAIDALLEQCAIALRGNIDSIIDDMDYFDGDFNAMEDVILEGVGY